MLNATTMQHLGWSQRLPAPLKRMLRPRILAELPLPFPTGNIAGWRSDWTRQRHEKHQVTQNAASCGSAGGWSFHRSAHHGEQWKTIRMVEFRGGSGGRTARNADQRPGRSRAHGCRAYLERTGQPVSRLPADRDAAIPKPWPPSISQPGPIRPRSTDNITAIRSRRS